MRKMSVVAKQTLEEAREGAHRVLSLALILCKLIIDNFAHVFVFQQRKPALHVVF